MTAPYTAAMTTRSNSTDQKTPPGAVVGVVGTVAAIAGALIILFTWQTPGYQTGFFIGGLLVVGGLLLRIESAIRGTSPQQDAPHDSAA